MKIVRSIIINAPVDKVWKVLAWDFEKVHEWASDVSSSGVAQVPSQTDKADMPGRILETSFGTCYEIFESYDEIGHTFTYKAEFENAVPGVTSARNTWHVETISDTQTRFSMTNQTEFNVFPGLFLRIPLRFQLPRILKMNLEEAKHYIETGKPHPRKVAAMQKGAKSISSPSTI